LDTVSLHRFVSIRVYQVDGQRVYADTYVAAIIIDCPSPFRRCWLCNPSLKVEAS
jgi:hypothetical protein